MRTTEPRLADSAGDGAATAQAAREAIIRALHVRSDIDPQQEIERRVAFLADYLGRSGTRALVLGISGGVDSTTAGRLCQLAVERVRAGGRDARFVAMRLPHGVQRDESDAQDALRFIAPDRVLDVNIFAAASGMLQALTEGGLRFADPAAQDFVFGNVKARERMVAQYAVAGAEGGLVVGTDHAAEAVMGFFTKYGDGACDVAPLTGLSKRQVRLVGRALGAPEHLVEKVPTADLEELRPQRPDEDAYGLSYAEIDAFLEGRPVPEHVAALILKQYRITAHKRALPVSPYD